MKTTHEEYHETSRLRILLYCLLIVGAGAIAYANATHGQFVYDDRCSLSSIHEVRVLDLATLWRTFNVRTIGYITFTLNYIFSGFSPFWFHFTNIVIHLVNACLVFFLARLVMKRAIVLDASRLSFKYVDPVALTAALIFAVHPIETQAVTFIIQRLASLVAMFYLLSVILYFKGRLMMEEGRSSGIPLIALAVAVAGLAMLTKQNAFTLPLAFLLVEFCFISPSWALMKKKVAIFAIAMVLMGVIPLALVISHGFSFDDIEQVTTAAQNISRHDYFITQINVVRTYLRLIFLPIAQRLDYSYPIYNTFLEGDTIMSAFLHIALWTAAIASFRKKRAVFFGIAFFYLALIVEAGVFPINDVLVEHRVYLPSVGIIIAASSLIWLVAKRMHARTTMAWISVGIVVAALSFATHLRNKAWADGVTIWKDNVEKDPKSWRAHYELGEAYKEADKLDEAMSEWTKSNEIRDTATAWNNMANVLLTRGDIDGAINAYKKSMLINPRLPLPYANIGTMMEKKGDNSAAIIWNEKAISADSRFQEAYCNIGRIHLKNKDYSEAERWLMNGIAVDPEKPDARILLAIVMMKTGRKAQAREELETVLELKPKHEMARELLGMIESGVDLDQLTDKEFKRLISD